MLTPHRSPLSPEQDGRLRGSGPACSPTRSGCARPFDADHIRRSTTRLASSWLTESAAQRRGSSSLGHSTIVFLPGRTAQLRHPIARQPVKAGSLDFTSGPASVGTSVSGFFLYLIAGLNIVIGWSRSSGSSATCAGASSTTTSWREQLNKRGLMNRLLGGFARKIDTPWKMYPVGVLSSGSAVGHGRPSGTARPVRERLSRAGCLLCDPVAPVLFAAGMCLFDTLDGCFMNFRLRMGVLETDPEGVHYNIITHGASRSAVAFVIGHDRARRAALGPSSNSTARFWDTMANFNINRAGFHHCGNVRGHLAVAPWRSGVSVISRRPLGPVRGPRQRREHGVRSA